MSNRQNRTKKRRRGFLHGNGSFSPGERLALVLMGMLDILEGSNPGGS
jgi:hypothetical protein